MIGWVVVFDTNVFIRYGDQFGREAQLLSAVVLQELAAGADDEKRLRNLASVRRQFEGKARLLVPDGEDWQEAGRVLNLLRRGQKSRRQGRVSAIPKEEQQRLLRDVLIARTARRVGAVVVTEDASDFEKIRRYCDVKTVHPQDFF